MRKLNILILLLVVAFLSSCKKESDLFKTEVKELPKITVNNGRLVFSSTDAMKETYSLLNTMSKEDVASWSKQYNYSNLQTVIENIKQQNEGILDSTSKMKYDFIPATMTNLLNDECEMQIGDTIIWVNKNIQYILVRGNEKSLLQLKEIVNQGNSTPSIEGLKIHEIAKIPIPANNKEKSLNGRWGDARYQYQFTTNSHEYKIVHSTNCFQYSGWVVVEVHINFEYWHDRIWPLADIWEPAGEQVTKHINNVKVYARSGTNAGNGTLNAGPITTNTELYRGVIFTWFTIDYVKINGEMKATVPQFNKTYNVSGVLWEKSF